MGRWAPFTSASKGCPKECSGISQRKTFPHGSIRWPNCLDLLLKCWPTACLSLLSKHSLLPVISLKGNGTWIYHYLRKLPLVFSLVSIITGFFDYCPWYIHKTSPNSSPLAQNCSKKNLWVWGIASGPWGKLTSIPFRKLGSCFKQKPRYLYLELLDPLEKATRRRWQHNEQKAWAGSS